jgi:hypothetical protein
MRHSIFPKRRSNKVRDQGRDSSEVDKLWARIPAVSAALAAILIPLVVLYVGNRIVTAEKEAELRLKYLELSIGILREAPSENTSALRAWAIQVLVRNTPVEISKEVLQELEKNKLLATGWDASYTNQESVKYGGAYTNPSTQFLTSECQGEACPKSQSSKKP